MLFLRRVLHSGILPFSNKLLCKSSSPLKARANLRASFSSGKQYVRQYSVAMKRVSEDSQEDLKMPNKRARNEDAGLQGDFTHVEGSASVSGRTTMEDSSIASKNTKSDAEVAETGDSAMPQDSNTESKSKREASSRPKSGKGKGKESKNIGRRRRAPRNEEGESERPPPEDGAPKAPRYPKRQCALLIGFCGSGYSGMQIQPSHTRTIEGVLFSALVKAGAVSQDNADDPVKVGLARAARTDAGVHAAGNLVSLKMIVTVPGVKDLVAHINEELPPEIRMWGYVRVQNSFNARLVCDSRKYTYFFPSYLLIPPKPGSGLYRALQNQTSQSSIAEGFASLFSDTFWKDTDLASTREADLLRKRSWRVDPEQVAKLRVAAQKYEGTHNFHNFTVGREFSDRSNHRHMKKIEIADPVVYGDTEWVSVLFHGQSFMLHQRKMIAALVLSARCGTPGEIIDELYGPRDVFIPKMPALGLLLEEPLFHSYNTRTAGVNEKFQPTDADYRPPIDFDIHRDQINAFKEEFIYKNMREVEDRDGIFDAWMRGIDAYAGNDLLYLGPTGTIPTASVIKKGERRDNPFKEKKIFDATSFPVDDNVKEQLVEEEEVEEEAVIDKKHLAETEG